MYTDAVPEPVFSFRQFFLYLMTKILTRTLISSASVLCALVLCVIVAHAQDTSTSGIHVIPRPREVRITQGQFRLKPGLTIALADAHSEDDRFAAQDFINDLKDTTGNVLKISKVGRHAILIGLLEQRQIADALKRASLEVPANLDAEGYLLSVTADEVVIGGKTPVAVFYGLQTLKQLVKGEGATASIPAIQIKDWPAMRWRGVSDDISRGPVPTVE